MNTRRLIAGIGLIGIIVACVIWNNIQERQRRFRNLEEQALHREIALGINKKVRSGALAIVEYYAEAGDIVKARSFGRGHALIITNDHVQVFIQFNGPNAFKSGTISLQELGAQRILLHTPSNSAGADIPLHAISEIAEISGIESITRVLNHHPTL